MKFGKANKGKVVHIAMLDQNKSVVARCDQRMAVEANDSLQVQDVTCAKCKQYAAYKEAIAKTIVKNDVKEIPDKEKKPEAKSKPEVKPAAKTKPEVKKDKTDPVKSELQRLKEQNEKLEKSLKKTERELQEARKPADPLPEKKEDNRPIKEEGYKELLKQSVQPKETVIGPEHFCTDKMSNGKYRVVHMPSNNAIMTGVEDEVVETVLKYLNNMKVKWESRSQPIPKEFLPACAAAIRAAYSNHGKKIDIGVANSHSIRRRKKDVEDKTQEKQERTIRRRKKHPKKAKEEQRQIKRRKKNCFGFQRQSVLGIISELIAEGNRYGEIVKEVQKLRKDLSNSDIKSKLQGVIRNLVRKGYTVVIVKVKDPNLCLYHIAEDNE